MLLTFNNLVDFYVRWLNGRSLPVQYNGQHRWCEVLDTDGDYVVRVWEKDGNMVVQDLT